MKETKVYVDKLPKSCVVCKYFAEHRRQCNLELCIEWNEVKFKFNDCPLIDIKTHDRELVKEVCEKIRNAVNKSLEEIGGNCNGELYGQYTCKGLVNYDSIEFDEILAQIQKEVE